MQFRTPFQKTVLYGQLTKFVNECCVKKSIFTSILLVSEYLKKKKAHMGMFLPLFFLTMLMHTHLDASSPYQLFTPPFEEILVVQLATLCVFYLLPFSLSLTHNKQLLLTGSSLKCKLTGRKVHFLHYYSTRV